MAAPDLPSQMRNMAAANVTPVVIHGEAQIDLISLTSAKQQLQPVQASVISVSEVKLPEGRTEIPPVNQVASVPLRGGLQPGPERSQHPGAAGLAGDTGSQAGHDSGKSQTVRSENGGSNEIGTSGSGAAKRDAVADKNAPGLSGSRPSTTNLHAGSVDADAVWTHVARPKDGRFSVVVVGSSQTEEYPETAEIWRGRLAYTVFLNVGNAKKWILQYSLPASEPTHGTRVDAPWPYDLSVPSSPGTRRQAVMVHGFLEPTGRLKQLSAILPGNGADLARLLEALQTWTFRPAISGGSPVTVEVLLIIPEDDD